MRIYIKMAKETGRPCQPVEGHWVLLLPRIFAKFNVLGLNQNAGYNYTYQEHNWNRPFIEHYLDNICHEISILLK